MASKALQSRSLRRLVKGIVNTTPWTVKTGTTIRIRHIYCYKVGAACVVTLTKRDQTLAPILRNNRYWNGAAIEYYPAERAVDIWAEEGDVISIDDGYAYFHYDEWDNA